MIVHLANAAVLIAYVVTSTAGLVLLKRSASLLTPMALAGLTLYLIGFGLWLLLLGRLPLSTAFPLTCGALILATQVAGVLWLNERVGGWHLAGAGLIVVGLVVLFLAPAKP